MDASILVLPFTPDDETLRLTIPSEVIDLPAQRSESELERVLGLSDVPYPDIPRDIGRGAVISRGGYPGDCGRLGVLCVGVATGGVLRTGSG